MKSITCHMEFTRATKNTWLFNEVKTEHDNMDIEQAIRTLYVQKDAMEILGNPKTITVTIQGG